MCHLTCCRFSSTERIGNDLSQLASDLYRKYVKQETSRVRESIVPKIEQEKTLAAYIILLLYSTSWLSTKPNYSPCRWVLWLKKNGKITWKMAGPGLVLSVIGTLNEWEIVCNVASFHSQDLWLLNRSVLRNEKTLIQASKGMVM